MKFQGLGTLADDCGQNSINQNLQGTLKHPGGKDSSEGTRGRKVIAARKQEYISHIQEVGLCRLPFLGNPRNSGRGIPRSGTLFESGEADNGLTAESG